MADLENFILDLAIHGNNCSQIMVILGLEMRNQENPNLVDAMFGFGDGFYSGGTCGTFLGGVALISMYMDGRPERKSELIGVIREYTNWFTNEYGSLECIKLKKEDRNEMLKNCGRMIETSFKKIMALLEGIGVDINC